LSLQQPEDEIHDATFYDFGYPPLPRRPVSKKRLAVSFWRGNDKRSPKLFNQENYRTTTFHVSACDSDRQVVDTQASISDSESVRPAGNRTSTVQTRFFLYCSEMVNAMFLTSEYD
jgi:hypothetical protein